MKSLFFAAALTLQFFLPNTWASPEGTLRTEFPKILNYWETHGSHLSFKGEKQKRVSFHVFDKGHGSPALLILPGRATTALAFAEFVYDLKDTPYTLYVLDHRGQGASERLTSTPDMQYVHKFEDYVADVKTLMVQTIARNGHSKIFLLGHSMGGAIATIFTKQNSWLVDAAIFATPMYRFKTGKYNEPTAKALAYGGCLLGQGKKFAPGQKGWNPDATFETADGTSSRTRFELDRSIYRDHPELRIGGSSFQWVRESFEMTDEISKYSAKNFKTPFLLLSAGAESDARVYRDAQDTFCQKMSTLCTQVANDQSKHGIFLESDPIRKPFVKAILNFLTRF